MLHNMNKLCKQQEIHDIEKDRRNSIGRIYDRIIRMMLEKQQEIQEEGEKTPKKRAKRGLSQREELSEQL